MRTLKKGRGLLLHTHLRKFQEDLSPGRGERAHTQCSPLGPEQCRGAGSQGGVQAAWDSAALAEKLCGRSKVKRSAWMATLWLPS